MHGAWSALRAPEGRVHFAGAHTALRWPSFMDGAVESGHSRAQWEAAGAVADAPRRGSQRKVMRFPFRISVVCSTIRF